MNEQEILDDLPYTSVRKLPEFKLEQKMPSKFKVIFSNFGKQNDKVDNKYKLIHFLMDPEDYIADIDVYLNIYTNLCNNLRAKCIKRSFEYMNVTLEKEYKINWMKTLEENREIDEDKYIIYLINDKELEKKYDLSRFDLIIDFDLSWISALEQQEILSLFYTQSEFKCCSCGELETRNLRNISLRYNKEIKNLVMCYVCMEKNDITSCYKCSNYGLLMDGYCETCYSKGVVNRQICKVCKSSYLITPYYDKIGICGDCRSGKEDKVARISNKIKEKTLKDINDNFWFIKFLDASFPESKKERTFGLEFEMNTKEDFYETFKKFLKVSATKRIYGFPLINYIVIKRDGSLDGETGIEFNTIVLKGKQGIQVLKELVNELNKFFDVDSKCGLHLHLGVSDYKEDDFRNLYFFYQRFQDSFGYYVKKERLHNTYCNLLQKRRRADILNRGSSSLTSDRYRAVNFKAIDEMNTIELRILEGTLDLEKILVWIEVNTKIVNYIKREPLLIHKKFVLTKLIRKILGRDLFSDYLERQKYYKYMESE